MNNSKPNGLWSSPITPQSLSQGLRLEDVQWDSDGQSIIWLQERSSQTSLICQNGTEAARELLNTLTVRGNVGYGGGEFCVSQGQVFFAEKDGRLYRQSLAYGQPAPITPAIGGCASPALSPNGKSILYVYSDGDTDLLGLADASGVEWPVQLVRGADFYMQPAWHPNGEQIAWVEWNHPNMPWDGTYIKLARFDPANRRVEDIKMVAGGDTIPASQPLFSPDGRWLALIEADGEWENLVLIDLQNNNRRVLLKGDGFHLTTPDWTQGQRSFGWGHDSQSLYSIRNFAGLAYLYHIRLDGTEVKLDTTPYTWIDQISVSPVNDQLLMIASAPSIPTRIVRRDEDGLHVVARSETETVDPIYFPTPQVIRWNASDGAQVYGLFYPPTNPDYNSSELPPALIAIHGGPTSQREVAYSSEVAYFTSRGYAVVEVNYRGSSGYGRTYRDALRERWGNLDVEDAVSCQKYLSAQKMVDGNRCVIKGGSAGGYTVLNVLVRYPGVFKAGICLYGVSNLFALDLDTHKFEQHYTQSLVGKLPEAASRYHAWSPIFHAAAIKDPIIIFQGSIDKVVPPSQSEEIVAALKTSGTSHRYILYEGEGHGFRKSENIANYLEETERFLLQHVLFAP